MSAGRLVVSLATHGGLAAGLRLGLPPRAVDTAALPAADADRLARLVAAARAEPASDDAAASPEPGAPRGADAVTYVVTVQADGEGETVLRRDDLTMTDAFADLVDWVEKHAPAP